MYAAHLSTYSVEYAHLATIWNTPTITIPTAGVAAAVAPPITITFPVHKRLSQLVTQTLRQSAYFEIVVGFLFSATMSWKWLCSVRFDCLCLCHKWLFPQEVMTMQCAVCRARSVSHSTNCLIALPPLTFVAPKVLGFHFLCSTSRSFFRDPFSRGGHSGARADGFKPSPVILSQ